MPLVHPDHAVAPSVVAARLLQTLLLRAIWSFLMLMPYGGGLS
jgi:hypothetical protein